MDGRVATVAEAHGGLIPWRGLVDAGLSPRQASRVLAQVRMLHRGVGVSGHGPVTVRQRRLAATLSAPGSALSHASAADHFGFRPWSGSFDVVTRPGSGGPRRFRDLLVLRSSTVADHVAPVEGILTTLAARTLIDLSPHLPDRERAKAVREAIRLRATTALELRLVAAAHRGRRGLPALVALAARLEDLPIDRTRSDAEARALEVLGVDGRSIPEVNVRIAGEEADLVWSATRSILEIDGPRYHRDPLEDARKEAVWRAAGWSVDRIPSDVPFDDPAELVAIATRLERPLEDRSGPLTDAAA